MFDETGFVYFEESVGSGGNIHEEINQVLEQWRYIREVIRYERMFLILAGMAIMNKRLSPLWTT